MIYITKGWLISAMIIGAGLFSACEVLTPPIYG